MKSSWLSVVAVFAASLGCGSNPPRSGGAGGTRVTTVITGLAGSGPPLTGAAGSTGMNCAAITRPAARLPPDILIVLDASVSMNDAVDGSCAGGCANLSKWSAAVTAIATIDTPSATRVNWALAALPSFPDACDVGRIAVPFGWGGAQQINDQLMRRTASGNLKDGGNSPMRAAIDVAASHLAGRDPAAIRMILLLTDGEPDCMPGASDTFASDAAGTARAIAAAAARGITTSVMGIATAGGPADATLNALARAGDPAASGYTAVANARELITAMDDLVGRTACTIVIPEPPTNDGTTSRGLINVYQSGLGAVIPQDPAHANGWDYTDDSLTAAQLYGAACDWLRTGNDVSVVFPCFLN